MNLPFFIAKRYLFAKKSHNVINLISAISAVGMAIGTAALIIILSVYNGFDSIISSSLSDLDPDILITASKGKVFVPEGEAFDWAYDCPKVLNISEVLQENVFVNYDNRQGVVKAKGVDAVFEDESGISSHIRSGEFRLHHGDAPMAAVGAGFAYKMGINPSFVAPLEIYFPARDRSISLANPLASINTVFARPSCVFSVNADVDAGLILLPIEAMRELLAYDNEVSGVEMRRSEDCSKAERKEIFTKLEELLGPDYKVLDRYHQNEAVYKMMKYEKASIFLILIFVVIIIAFNIFGSLSMLIIEKKSDIETFRSLGASDKLIRKFFVLEGWMISMLGLCSGLIIGVLIAFIQQSTGLVKMPGGFLVSAYPVVVQLKDLLITFVSVSLIGYLIALVPVANAFRKH